MDTITKLISWLKTLPIWLRAIALLAIAGLALIASMSLSACGVTRATVSNRAEGTSTEIKITTSNPTSVTATPNVEIKTPQ